jgi:drug/metabolite transporter, DME family
MSLQSIPSLPPRPAHRRLGLLAIAVAATLWSIAAIVASELFASGVQPFELAMARTVIAAVGLALVSQVGADRGFSRRWFEWRLVLLGLSLAFVTVSYYVAIDRLAVAVALVIQYTAPALVVVLTALQARRLPAPAIFISTGLAILGVLLVSGVVGSQLELNSIGLAAAGLSALFFASYTLLSESVVHTYGAIGVMFRAFIVSSLFWIAFQSTQGIPTAVLLPANLPGILFIGIGGTLIPFSLLCWGIQQVRAAHATIAATLEPVVAAVLAWVWLGQTLNGVQLMGGTLVLIAVVSLQLRLRQAEG